jgi:radical SAM enzyme (TIGR01210 family)
MAKISPASIPTSTSMVASLKDPSKPIFSWLQNTPLGKEIFISLYTKKCNWSKCTFCSLPSVSSPTQVDPEQILNQARSVFDSYRIEELRNVRRVFISNNGSVFDEDTLPLDVLYNICELAHVHCPYLQGICFETRYEYTVKAALENFIGTFRFWHDLFTRLGIRKEKYPVKVQISSGYETYDSYLRNNILNKGIPEEIVQRSFAICSEVNQRTDCPILFDTYVLLKPAPNMTNEEAVEESVKTIAHLNGLGKRFNVPVSIRLNPTFVAKNSSLHKDFREKKYTPPTLKDVMSVLHMCDAQNIKIPIFVGLNDEGLGVTGGGFGENPKTWNPYREALQKFNYLQDYKSLACFFNGNGSRSRRFNCR